MEEEEEEHRQCMAPSQTRDRRPDALGDMKLLPDEILCDIIDRLDAPDVARLACVSSIMYIFCNEEPLWINLCLKKGGQLEYKGSWKMTFLIRENLSVGDNFKRTLKFDGFSSLFLYKRWYRCFTTLESFSLDCDGLQRKKNLSIEEFYSDYDGQKPVLLTDLSNDWPASKTWTIPQLLQDYGDISFRISQRSSKKLTMKFKHYVSYMEFQHDEDPLYIFDDKFGEAAPNLLKDYEIPLLFREDLFDVLDYDQRPPFRWLIIGPERSGASWHVDPALTSAWNTLLLGRKRWALYPPGRVPAGVTVHVNEEDGDVDIETPSSLQWWLDVYPLLSDEDKPIECTQLPGETIFVPSGWWHCVLNLETTVAVTQNFVNVTNFELVCLDMAPGHLHKGVCRAGLLAAQDVKELDFHRDQNNYAATTRKEKRSRKRTELESDEHSNVKQMLQIIDVPQIEEFSYDINYLSKFLDKQKDHYSSIWNPSNSMGQREMRAWLHKLWATKPDLRELIWKGASIALNIDRWTACLLEICGFHGLKSPLEEEMFPVGTGSNPVYLVSDYVIKIFVEGGLEASLYSLGTEVEFYTLLQKADSYLVDNIPKILASGIITCEDGTYTRKAWKEVGDLDAIPWETFACTQRKDVNCHLDVWRKMQFECIKTKAVTSTMIWPYLVTERCNGEILANLRGGLSKNDGLYLASFLGYQLRKLHLLPVPIMQNIDVQVGLMTDLRKEVKCLDVDSKVVKFPDTEKVSQTSKFSLECALFTATIDRRRRDLVDRLIQWGDPIPRFLIEKVKEYIPTDIALLLNFLKDTNDLHNFCGSLAWIHSDVMDDNIHMAVCSSDDFSDKTIPILRSEVNHTEDRGYNELKKIWRATHILDFSNLSIGDPLCDIIPLYLDVLRGDVSLLSQVLASYGLPLSRKLPDGQESRKKFYRLSYRAMCYCILHEDNVLGAIFGLWEELRLANSWEEVEESVWGELNKYVPTDDY